MDDVDVDVDVDWKKYSDLFFFFFERNNVA